MSLGRVPLPPMTAGPNAARPSGFSHHPMGSRNPVGARQGEVVRVRGVPQGCWHAPERSDVAAVPVYAANPQARQVAQLRRDDAREVVRVQVQLLQAARNCSDSEGRKVTLTSILSRRGRGGGEAPSRLNSYSCPSCSAPPDQTPAALGFEIRLRCVGSRLGCPRRPGWLLRPPRSMSARLVPSSSSGQATGRPPGPPPRSRCSPRLPGRPAGRYPRRRGCRRGTGASGCPPRWRIRPLCP